MLDARVVRLAEQQHRCVARWQLRELGLSETAIAHRVAQGRLVNLLPGVLAIAPVFPDDHLTRWMAATLTAKGSVLSHASAAALHGFRRPEGSFEIVTRPGSGGPRRCGGVLCFRSVMLEGDVVEVHGIPVTSGARALLDLAPLLSPGALARSTREALRLGATTHRALLETLDRHPRRRGSRRVRRALARYEGLAIDRTRSASEAQALLVLRDAGASMPSVNVKVGGLEADLVWREQRLIVEIDGEPFHRDRGEDERKEAVWREAGFAVRRLPSDDVWVHPERLLALTNVQNHPS